MDFMAPYFPGKGKYVQSLALTTAEGAMYTKFPPALFRMIGHGASV
jgi:hypothetical protein